MITYKIHLIRTGNTGESPTKRYIGQSDVPLCESGRKALKELRKKCRYPDVDMVYTSPLSRCVETAGILYPDISAVQMEGLMDMNLGEFEGKTFEELGGNSDFADWIKNSIEHTPPGGERAIDFTQRIILALNGIFSRMMKERVTSVAVVTHGGVIMALLASVGLPKMPMRQWAVDNGCGYTLLMTPQMWMRDRAAEIFAGLPESPEQENMPK